MRRITGERDLFNFRTDVIKFPRVENTYFEFFTKISFLVERQKRKIMCFKKIVPRFKPSTHPNFPRFA